MAGEVDNARGVEDQTHAAISKDCAPGDAFYAAKPCAQSLGDHLALAEQFIDEKPAALSAIGHDHNEGVGRIFYGTMDIEEPVQPKNGDERPAQNKHFAATRNC